MTVLYQPSPRGVTVRTDGGIATGPTFEDALAKTLDETEAPDLWPDPGDSFHDLMATLPVVRP